MIPNEDTWLLRIHRCQLHSVTAMCSFFYEHLEHVPSEPSLKIKAAINLNSQEFQFSWEGLGLTISELLAIDA